MARNSGRLIGIRQANSASETEPGFIPTNLVPVSRRPGPFSWGAQKLILRWMVDPPSPQMADWEGAHQYTGQGSFMLKRKYNELRGILKFLDFDIFK